MFSKILVVRVGNICRPPTAERLLRQFRPALTVSSAGLGALMGRGADPCAISAAQVHNLSLDSHCVQQITGRMCREYDLILAMEKCHISALCKMVPGMRDKMMPFRRWDSEHKILDPCRKSCDLSSAVYALLERSARQQAQALSAEQGEQ